MKYVYTILGCLCIALGVIGIFLPLLPTTPFLLLAAFLLYKGSPKYYNWLLNHKYLGPYIKNFRENKAIPLRIKILALFFLWLTILLCVCVIIKLLWVKIVLLCIATAVSIHILSFKTLKK